MPKNIYYDDVKILKKPLKTKLILILKIFLFIVTIVGVVFCSTFLSEALTVGNVSSLFIYGDNKIRLQEKKYYAVTLGVFDILESAEKFSVSSQIQGGSGFIWQEDRYYIIGNIYNNIESANSVVKNIENSNFEVGVKEINFPKKVLVFEDYENSEIYEIEKSFNFYDELYNKLYDYSIKLDKGEINKLAVSSGISELRGEIKKLIIKNQMILNKENSYLQKIQNSLIEVDELLNSAILQALNGEIGNFGLKYTLVAICRSEYNLVNSL